MHTSIRKSFTFTVQNVNFSDYYCTERKLLPIVAEFCHVNNLYLTVVGSQIDSHIEKKYYSEILKKFKWKFIRRKNSISNYKLIDKFSIIVFIDSTLGYESIVRNKKIAVFSTRQVDKNDKASPFGWPKRINKRGFFYSNNISKKEVFRVLRNVLLARNFSWKKKTSKIFNGIIDFNFNNKKFFQVVNKYY